MTDSAFATIPRRDRLRWAMLILLCLFCALAGRLCYLARPFDNDAAIFIYMGKMVSEGGRLCHDLVDNKFPTVGLMTSILWRAFGASWTAHVLFQTSLALAGACLLAEMAGRHVGRHAVLPTGLFALVYLNFTHAVFGGFQLETAQAVFAILGARSALLAMEEDARADSFLAGLCAGCAAMLKPTGLAVLGAMAIGLLVRDRNTKPIWRHLPSTLAGVSIPLLTGLIYITGTHLLGDMPALWRQIATYAAQSAWASEDWLKPLLAAGFIAFPMIVRGWIYRRQRGPGMNWPARPVVTFALVWLLVESLGVVMQRRMYAYHFLPIIPPAALVFGLFPRSDRPWSIAAAIAPIALLSLCTAGEVMAQSYTAQDHLPATAYLATHAKPGDAIWTDCWPRLVLETNLHPGSRLPFTFLFANYDQAGLDYSQLMIDDFERIKPAYIFIPVPLDKRVQYQVNSVAELMRRPVRAKNYAGGWHRIEQYTLEHYTREAVVGGEIVYHRRADGIASVAGE